MQRMTESFRQSHCARNRRFCQCCPHLGAGRKSKVIHYWMIAGACLGRSLGRSSRSKCESKGRGPQSSFIERNARVLAAVGAQRTDRFLPSWRSRLSINLSAVAVDPAHQIDNYGAIIAANEQRRDAVQSRYLPQLSVARAMERWWHTRSDLAGYPEVSLRAFSVLRRCAGPRWLSAAQIQSGQVARVVVASVDHRQRATVIPIQEDETALVVWALWKSTFSGATAIWNRSSLWYGRRLIRQAADFMVRYRESSSRNAGAFL